MQHHRWSELADEQLNPLVSRQMFHGSTMTVARIRLRKGAIVPAHSHVNEQITLIEQGAVVFITPLGRQVVRAGETLCTPPNLSHSVEALEDSVALDIFSPVREDWIRGEDAYLRR
jgi:quercetin dioxygenase-like cupin family protein